MEKRWIGAIVTLLAAFTLVAECVRSVRLVLPLAVKSGSSVTLLCLYDLENAPLYSVKWYRGRYEFYRYVPRERPAGRVFAFPGIQVDLSSSGARQVTLHSLPLHLSGPFSCEVSADAPTFSTACATASLTVIEYVSGRPVLTVQTTTLTDERLLVANCSSPAPKLEFYVNNQQMPEDRVQVWPSGAMLQTSVERANFSARGEMRVRCAAIIAHTLRVMSPGVSVWWGQSPDNHTASGGPSVGVDWTWIGLNVLAPLTFTRVAAAML